MRLVECQVLVLTRPSPYTHNAYLIVIVLSIAQTIGFTLISFI